MTKNCQSRLFFCIQKFCNKDFTFKKVFYAYLHHVWSFTRRIKPIELLLYNPYIQFLVLSLRSFSKIKVHTVGLSSMSRHICNWFYIPAYLYISYNLNSQPFNGIGIGYIGYNTIGKKPNRVAPYLFIHILSCFIPEMFFKN